MHEKNAFISDLFRWADYFAIADLSSPFDKLISSASFILSFPFLLLLQFSFNGNERKKTRIALHILSESSGKTEKRKHWPKVEEEERETRCLPFSRSSLCPQLKSRNGYFFGTFEINVLAELRFVRRIQEGREKDICLCIVAAPLRIHIVIIAVPSRLARSLPLDVFSLACPNKTIEPRRSIGFVYTCISVCFFREHMRPNAAYVGGLFITKSVEILYIFRLRRKTKRKCKPLVFYPYVCVCVAQFYEHQVWKRKGEQQPKQMGLPEKGPSLPICMRSLFFIETNQ